MRGLNDDFLEDLKNGFLRGIISRVKEDDTLALPATYHVHFLLFAGFFEGSFPWLDRLASA